LTFVVAVEGFDGSGKTSVSLDLARFVRGRGFTAQIVGKRALDSSTSVAALTRLIVRAEGGLLPFSVDGNFYLRLARLAERQAASARPDLLILDRWVLSELGQLADGQHERFLNLSRAADILADLTIILDCPFPMAWERVRRRRRALTPRQRLGADINERLSVRTSRLAQEWGARLSPTTVLVDSSRSLEEVTETARKQLQEAWPPLC
jgi:thymidylate kinase